MGKEREAEGPEEGWLGSVHELAAGSLSWAVFLCVCVLLGMEPHAKQVSVS